MHARPLLSALALVAIVLPGCSGETALNPEPKALDLPAPASVSPVKEYAFSDYVPRVAGLYGTKTYWTEPGSITSRIVGTETVPYDPPLTGVVVGFESASDDVSWVFRTRQKQTWLLRQGDYVRSRTCGAYSAYPESSIIGYVHDGMILDLTGGADLWQVNVNDPADCMQLNTGYGDSNVLLVQIQDVRLPDRHVAEKWTERKDEIKWHTYENAILTWELEPNRPDLHFQLDLGEWEEILGIRPPTAAEAHNWAIDDLTIWGREVGILLQGDVHLDDGGFEVTTVLVSETREQGG